MFETLLQDIRYGIRTLFKNLGFTIVAVLVLALGIGANTAIFSVVNAVLLRSLPYKDADRIMMVWENDTQEGNPKNSFAPGNYVDVRDQNQVFEQTAFYTQPAGLNLTGSEEPERVEASGSSASILQTLGVQPAVGRAFTPEEEKPGANPVAIISNGLWRQRFGASPAVLNTPVTLDGKSYNVVGVLPPDFELPEKIQILIPLPFDAKMAANRSQHSLRVVGRLKPGATLEQARVNLVNIARQLEQQFPETNKGRSINVIPIREQFVGDVRQALLVLFGAVGCVLLIACTNVANLLLTRGATRHKEFAIRTALGATRMRVIRQLLVESVLLSVMGGMLGLLIALWATDLFITFAPTMLPRGTEAGLNSSALLFTLGISVLTGVVFGLLPALQVSKPDLNEVLKEGGRVSSDGIRINRIGKILVTSEIALSLLLLVGAGLMIKSFMRLQQVDPGFNPENVLTMQVSLPQSRYSEDQKVTSFYRQLQERIRSLPGVRSSAVISRLPLAGDRATASVTIEGRPSILGEEIEAHYRVITPDYFRVLSIPMVKGRELSEQDAEEAPPAVIINESMVRAFFSNEDPIGKRIRLGANPSAPWASVVGVVRDARNFGLEAESRHEVYMSYLQDPPARARLVVHTASDPLTLVNPIKSEIRSLDSNLSVAEVTTMEKLLADSSAPQRFSVLMLSIFAGVAMVLAAIGIYGVIAYSVSQRTHELGIRMAFGAQPKDILNLIVGQGAKLALIGVGIGLVAAFLLTRVMAGLLYGVSETDPMVFAGLALLLLIVALIACFIPARRATKVDPMVALRYE